MANLTFNESNTCIFLKKKQLLAPFYGWRFNCLKATEPLQEDSLLFTTKSPEIPGTHLIDLGMMKGWVDLGATQWSWTQDPWIRNPASQALGHIKKYLIFLLFFWIDAKIPIIHIQIK